MTENGSKREASYLPRSWGTSEHRKKISDSMPATVPFEREPDAENEDLHHPSNNTSKGDFQISSCECKNNWESRIPCSEDEFESLALSDGKREYEGALTIEASNTYDCRPRPIDAPSETFQALTRVRLVGIRFGSACKIYHFDCGDMELVSGDWVIVKTEKGIGLGQVVLTPFNRDLNSEQLEGLRKVLRIAGKVDFDHKERSVQRQAEAHKYCLERIESLGLPMKLIGVECFFDGSKYVFYFTAEGRVDFRELVKQLVVRFPVRIEMRQIGVRHEAKMLGGIATCGQHLCCSRFLTDFRPVSVKMAKVQNLSLNPSKISGVCGRLMCCLGYEHDVYEEFRKGLPKVGKVVTTPQGDGVVVKHNPLSETVFVRLSEETIAEFSKEEIMSDPNSAVDFGDDKDDLRDQSLAGENELEPCDKQPSELV
jgi:cell fate regulator YaaT (PSP1 superfamily)